MLSLAPPSNWRVPPGGPGAIGPLRWGAGSRAVARGGASVGVAVDLGTSHISVAIVDLVRARPLALRVGPNPQGAHGADVMTRLVVAGDPDHAATLAGLARAAVGEAISEIARSEGIDLQRVSQVQVVGNMAMLSLLADRNHQRLLDPANWSQPIEVCAARDGVVGAGNGGSRLPPRSRWWRRWRVSSGPTCSPASSPSACWT